METAKDYLLGLDPDSSLLQDKGECIFNAEQSIEFAEGYHAKKMKGELDKYNEWLVNVWNPNQLNIPFMVDAPQAYIDYKNKLTK